MCHNGIAAGAGHVDRNDVRIAWDVFADVTPQKARIGVVAAADRGADIQVDRLTLVERRQIVLGVAGRRQQDRAGAGQHRSQQKSN